jgi:hypothetical protein
MASDFPIETDHPAQDGDNSFGSVSPGKLKSEVFEAAKPFLDTAAEKIDEKKKAGADTLRSLADAIISAAPGFEEQMPRLAASIRDAGSWVNQSATTVRQQKFEELIESVGNFAREKPMIAFSVATLSGLALSRFLKASPREKSANSSDVTN